MFHLMFVYYTFSSVLVAEWPPFGKKLPLLGWPFAFMPQTLKKWGTCWFRLVHVCVCVWGGGGASRYRLETSCTDSSWKIADVYFWFSLNYLPLLNYDPLTNKGMQFCKCCISKSIIARNLTLVSADRG